MTALELKQNAAARHSLAPAGIALAVCLGYYLGALVGLELRLPPATPSVVWPPNATLTAALLLTRRDRWWIVLAAALPAHLAVQLQTDWPRPLIAALFFTNCFEALIAAVGFRLLSDGVPRLDTFSRLRAFIAAAGLAAPLISSFADAAVVNGFLGEPYWQVWRFRLFSNILAELTVAAGIIGVVAGTRQWLERKSWWRLIEASAIGIGLLSICVLDFAGKLPTIPAVRAMFIQTPGVVQLPFVLWAAVRFGAAGTSVTMLLITLINSWQLVHAAHPVVILPPLASVTAMTLSLIVGTVTILSLSTLIDDRRHSQKMLAARLRFEELLSGLSRAFVQLPSNRMDHALDAWLARIGSFLTVDCLGMVIVTNGVWDRPATHCWRNAGDPRGLPGGAVLDLPWTVQQLSPRRHTLRTQADELPPEASADRESLAGLGLKTVLINPLVGGDGLLGALVCGAPEETLNGSELSSSLRLVGNVLAGILERKAAEDSLRTSELMKTSILQSLTTGVVVVDGESMVLAQNQTWLQLARAAGCVDVSVGSSFLGTLETGAAAGNRLASRIADALAAVLAGVQPRVVLEHTSETGAETRWWSVQVVPLTGARRGAVVTRADITDVRRAELEALRSRQDLAHVARVATVGELTASIAHQLNQPLSAIMTNAQAASRILEWTEPDLEEVRAILVDIVKDDRRASEVIQRVRELLRNGELQMQWIDLSALIREVADLLSSETIMRDVALSLSFDRIPIYAKGDRVQLQQVVLNLLQNAMEAMSDEHRSGRVIHVSCRAEDNGPVHVSVQDSGQGVRTGAEQTIFEPFYTTKSGGMGMGLSIVRSIVEAHGGSIRVRNHPSGGAIFEFTLQRAIIRPVA
jgi:signal transduction histidine kinase/integral membrane sensor domain MASE1